MSKALRLGIFVVAALAVFGAGIFWIGSRDFRFTATYRLNAEFQNVAGLADGAAVRVGGIHQGTVRRIDLPPRPDQKVRVEMDLKGQTRNVIKKDSVAAIRTEGLVGDQYVEITFGSPEAPSVNSGDTIGTEPPLQISDLIKKTNNILDSAQGAMQNVDQTTAKINQGKGTLGALVNDRSVYQQVNQAAGNLRDDTEALKHNFLLRGFFNKRGYEDQTDVTRYAIAEMPKAAPAERFSYPGDKLFDKPDGSKLKKPNLLDGAGRYLEANRFGLAVVAASADLKGDTDKQRQLTEARAAVVREYLVEHYKVDDTRIRVIGLGKSPEVPDGGSIEIRVYTQPAGAPVAASRK
jgi:phospholipid/cholesterol/gamma-HCH transport system substrate-binding protein